MIFAEVRDGLTRALVTRGAQPGMDSLLWTETDTEEDIRTTLLDQENADMRAGGTALQIAPWPLDVSPQAPVDLTQRYKGLLFRLHELDRVADEWCPVPGGVAVIDDPDDPAVDRFDRDHQNMSRMLRPDEVRATAEDPTKWIRLPFANETNGTVLKEPLWMSWHGLQGPRFTIELPDNDIFTPTDLRHPERYSWVDDDGKAVENGEQWAGFGDRSRLVLYLRPRRWRWIVTVYCIFEYDDWWGSSYNYEWFISVFYLRPPFYPYRHDIALTAQPDHYTSENFLGEPRSYDAGIESAWDLSWHSRDLRRQILDQQWYSLCEAYTFVDNYPPDIAIQAYPPRFGEIVFGIGFMDEATGHESRIWAQVSGDLSTVYPQRTVGQFIADWSV